VSLPSGRRRRPASWCRCPAWPGPTPDRGRGPRRGPERHTACNCGTCRYLVVLADAGTFHRAAGRLFIAQPTLSQQIRRLEEIVGTPLLRRRRDGLQLTAAGRVLLDASRTALVQVDQAVSRTRQEARPGRPRLRVVLPWRLEEPLAVAAAARLQKAAAAAQVDVAWLEMPLDAEFSLLGTRRADAGLGWLTTNPETLPAALEAMVTGEFEPEVWIPGRAPGGLRRRHQPGRTGQPAGHPRAAPRRARDLRRVDLGDADSQPPVRLHRPAVALPAAGDPGLRRHRQPAHRDTDQPGYRRRRPARVGPATGPGRGQRHGPGQPPAPPADRLGGPRLARRPAPGTVSPTKVYSGCPKETLPSGGPDAASWSLALAVAADIVDSIGCQSQSRMKAEWTLAG